MLPNFPRCDNEAIEERGRAPSEDDLNSIIEHYKRTAAAEKKLARAIDSIDEAERSGRQGSLHGPISPTD